MFGDYGLLVPPVFRVAVCVIRAKASAGGDARRA